MENNQNESRNPAGDNAIIRSKIRLAKREGVTKGAIIAVAISAVFIIASGIAAYSYFKREQEKQFAMLEEQKVVYTLRVNERDSVINEWLLTFDQIEKDLNTIKQKENVLTYKSGDVEFTKSRRDQILEDIRQINTLLENNKKKIADLSAQLNRSGNTMKGLNARIETLETTISQYEASVTELKSELEKKDFEIVDLNNKMTTLEVTVAERNDSIVRQTDLMNKAYLVSGTFKELKDRGIVSKNGGFLGFGKGGALAGDMNEENFTLIDVREIRSIPVNSKNAKLISKHPSDSYTMIEEGKNRIAAIEITDPDSFWKISKFAVVEIVK